MKKTILSCDECLKEIKHNEYFFEFSLTKKRHDENPTHFFIGDSIQFHLPSIPKTICSTCANKYEELRRS